MDTFATYLAAATAFAGLVDRIGDAAWGGPGLGAWNLRDLVGHTASGGLREVCDALDRPADPAAVAITSPEGYYALARTVDPAYYAAAVAASTEDARRRGAELGADPAGAVRGLVARAAERFVAAEPGAVVTTAAGAMVLRDWLPTRTFELAVHSLDIAASAGVAPGVPEDAVTGAVVLAARIAAVVGDGPAVLRALTGRGALPAGYSVV